MNSLSEQEFSVFCDELVRDTVDRNKRLCQENASLEPLRSLLHSINIRLNGETLKELNLLDYDQEGDDEDEFLSYSIQDVDEFPYELVRQLDFTVSGTQAMQLGGIGVIPKISILEKNDVPSAELVVQFTNEVKVTGILTDFAGSVEDVQDMIDSGRFVASFMSMGLMDARMMRFMGVGVLDNAMLSLTKLEIRKQAVQQALSCNEITVDSSTSEQVKELKKLAKVNDVHEGLVKVADEFESLVTRNAILKECSNLVRTVEARYPGGSIRYRLDAGQRTTGLTGESVWLMESSAGENSTVPVTSISSMEIHLAGFPLSSPINPVNLHPPQFTPHPLLILRYSPFIVAIYGFDESIDIFDFEVVHPVHFILNALENVEREEQSEEQQPELTMRLLELQVDMRAVQYHLDLLGVNTAATIDEEDS